LIEEDPLCVLLLVREEEDDLTCEGFVKQVRFKTAGVSK